MENLMHCRLCSYQSDQRLMLNVFEQESAYAEKIENYLGLKVVQSDKPSACICFHCSQTIDNFHNYATKIKAIQKILNPEEIYEVTYVTLIPDPDSSSADVAEKAVESPEICQHDSMRKDEPSSRDIVEVSQFSPEDAGKNYPSVLLDSKGQLIYKGDELMSFMSSFFSTSCEHCPKSFEKITELFRHQKQHHKIIPYVSCCSSKLMKIPGIIWHFVRHIQPEAFRCHICSYSVSRPKFLERHLQIHTDPSLKPFSCDKCDKRFIWKGALRAHLHSNHQPESERRDFVCPVCQRKYQSSGSLSWHKKTAHSEIQQVKTKNLCEICSKTFATVTSFKEHMLTHSEDCEKLQLQCKVCGKWLKNQRCLKSHMLLHAEVDHNCTVCSYTTKKEHLLKNHILTKHTSDRPWTCDLCEKTFKVKRALTIHKAQNHIEGAKSGRTCEFCNKYFGSSTNYYTHRKNQHPEELNRILAEKDEAKKLKRIKIGLEPPSSDEETAIKVEKPMNENHTKGARVNILEQILLPSTA